MSDEEKAEKNKEFKAKIKRAIEAIDDFESDTAVEILQGLHEPDMDPTLNDNLCKAGELIDDFEYDEAVELLKKILGEA